MLVDERRETVGVLRLIGLPARRILVQVLHRRPARRRAPARCSAWCSPCCSESLINAFFQWRYDTALVFVRITPRRGAHLDGDRRAARRVGHGAGVLGAAAPQRPAAGPPMNAVGFAWRSLVRQPARATLGVLGVAAVGALLFDMLLLSQGLVVSMRDLLERSGWDIRVSVRRAARARRPRPGGVARPRSASPHCRRSRPRSSSESPNARIERGGGPPIAATFEGVSGRSKPWRADHARRGRCCAAATRRGAERSGDRPGALPTGREPRRRRHGHAARLVRRRRRSAAARARCRSPASPSFPFAGTNEDAIGGSLDALEAACGGNVGDEADLLLVTSTGDVDARPPRPFARPCPDCSPMTNDEVVGRLQQTGFTYFRQISTVLTTVTLVVCAAAHHGAADRLGQPAARRDRRAARARLLALRGSWPTCCRESALIVGLGGVLSLPLGLLLASGLDRILKGMPGIPAELHFFVFEPHGPRHARRAARRHGDHRRALSDAHRLAAADRRDAARRGDRMIADATPVDRATHDASFGRRVVRDAGRPGSRRARRVAADSRRRSHRGARTVGLRQVHAAPHARLRGRALVRHAAVRRPRRRDAVGRASAACCGCGASASSSSASSCCRC